MLTRKQRYLINLFVKQIITKDFTQALSMLVRFPNPFFQVRLLHTKYRISSFWQQIQNDQRSQTHFFCLKNPLQMDAVNRARKLQVARELFFGQEVRLELALASGWRPLGPFDLVLRAIRPLRPCKFKIF